MQIMDSMKDPQLLRAMGLGDKLLGSIIVMILGLVICMVVLSIIMLIIKLLRVAGGREKSTAAGHGSASSQNTGGPPSQTE
ncbi:MAG: hypothetical protein GX254_06510 [Clostridiales bacterium]|jgi:Na+-transporting methylmalonyl-CoA/oxaloacetate decarboxylase gamma subunit|nr:hypothetical protein [Clostridiales bacterium]